MAAKEVKKATVNLTCPICYQLFNNPKFLPCHHSYCEQCLEKMQAQSKIICPECRKEAIVPAGGVKDLPNNFFINRMVDELVLKHKVEGEEEEVKCDECDEDEPVVAYCPECNLFFCHVCNESHKRNRRSRGHGIVPLTELQSYKDAKLQAKVKIPHCKEHDEQLKYYCETCEQLVCMYCTVKEHNGHDHDTVKKMATKRRNELKEVTAPINMIIGDLSKAHDNIDQMRKKMRRLGDEVDKKIDQHYNELVQKLMKQKEQLKQQAHDAVSQREKALTVQQEEVEYAQAEVLSMKELKDAIEKSSDQETLSAKKQVVAHCMQQITDKFNKLNTDLLQSATMEFIPSKESFPQFGQLFTHIDPDACEVVNLLNHITLGKELKFSIITKYRNDSLCSIGGSQVSVQLESTTAEVTNAQVRDNSDGSYMAFFLAQQVGEVKLSVSINGQQIKGSPYSVVVHYDYFRVGKPIRTVNNDGDMDTSWGIAFDDDGIWAVAYYSKHCVYIFDGQDQLIRKVGNYGSGNGQLNRPIGVTFDRNNYLYVADCYNNRVQKFDVSGNYVHQFGSNRSTKGQLNTPIGVTTRNNKVFVANNKRISVFHTNGEFSHIIGKGQLGNPVDVTVNTNNQLLVADYSHHCIYTFTLDGNYVSKFATQGSARRRLCRPISLTIDLYGFILVAEYGNHRVSIFNEDGKFIHCFGSKGSDDGNFQYPCGIALSPNGSIYVTDANNKRVQVFST